MGRVSEFEAELNRRAKPRYGEWHAIDLHNHTPTSDDYQYRQRTLPTASPNVSVTPTFLWSCLRIMGSFPKQTSSRISATKRVA